MSIASGADAIFSLVGPNAQGIQVSLRDRRHHLCACCSTCAASRNRSRSCCHCSSASSSPTRILIVVGIAQHADTLTQVMPMSGEAHARARPLDPTWFFFGLRSTLALRIRSVASTRHRSIEAVSNNIIILKEPRVRTGHWTMFYMASSLAFTAGGIILLYQLWQVKPVHDQTLNAVVFRAILDHMRMWAARVPMCCSIDRWRAGRRPPVRRRQYRFSRCTGGDGQHGRRPLGAAPIPSALQPHGDAERRADDGPCRACHSHRQVTAMSRCWWCSTASTYF